MNPFKILVTVALFTVTPSLHPADARAILKDAFGDSLSIGRTVFEPASSASATDVSCTVAPSAVTNSVGALERLVATVVSNGVPRSGALVNFAVTSGPNAGKSGSAFTSASGQASFDYYGEFIPGPDAIRATSLGVIGTTNVVWIAPDSVGDGIPDWWRATYFGGDGGTTNNQSCAACDADGTGQNNLFKYVAGLDPTNSASLFSLSVLASREPAQAQLTYGPIAKGRAYGPQFSLDLNSNVWTTLTGFTAQTNDAGEVTITDPNAAQASKFYRISITLP